MIWINPNESAAATVKYHTQDSRQDYYSQDQAVVGNWGGKAAARLGLTGKVETKPFTDLCFNINPATGTNLTPRTRADRTCSYDITFDCPKSVSVMFAWTNDRRLEEAFYQAARETMVNDVEPEARTRVRLNGQQDGDRVTGELVWAEYPHFTARPVDGQGQEPIQIRGTKKIACRLSVYSEFIY